MVIKIAILIAVACLGVSGCGQKGPLKLPSDTPPTDVSSPPTPPIDAPERAQ